MRPACTVVCPWQLPKYDLASGQVVDGVAKPRSKAMWSKCATGVIFVGTKTYSLLRDIKRMQANYDAC